MRKYPTEIICIYLTILLTKCDDYISNHSSTPIYLHRNHYELSNKTQWIQNYNKNELIACTTVTTQLPLLCIYENKPLLMLFYENILYDFFDDNQWDKINQITDMPPDNIINITDHAHRRRLRRRKKRGKKRKKRGKKKRKKRRKKEAKRRKNRRKKRRAATRRRPQRRPRRRSQRRHQRRPNRRGRRATGVTRGRTGPRGKRGRTGRRGRTGKSGKSGVRLFGGLFKGILKAVQNRRCARSHGRNCRTQHRHRCSHKRCGRNYGFGMNYIDPMWNSMNYNGMNGMHGMNGMNGVYGMNDMHGMYGTNMGYNGMNMGYNGYDHRHIGMGGMNGNYAEPKVEATVELNLKKKKKKRKKRKQKKKRRLIAMENEKINMIYIMEKCIQNRDANIWICVQYNYDNDGISIDYITDIIDAHVSVGYIKTNQWLISNMNVDSNDNKLFYECNDNLLLNTEICIAMNNITDLRISVFKNDEIQIQVSLIDETNWNEIYLNGSNKNKMFCKYIFEHKLCVEVTYEDKLKYINQINKILMSQLIPRKQP